MTLRIGRIGVAVGGDVEVGEQVVDEHELGVTVTDPTAGALDEHVERTHPHGQRQDHRRGTRHPASPHDRHQVAAGGPEYRDVVTGHDPERLEGRPDGTGVRIRRSVDPSTRILRRSPDSAAVRPDADVYARSEPTLRQPLESGDQRAVMHATLDLLSTPGRSTVMVLEDTQWADEATLDLITFLGRRIARSNGLLVLSYRDVEVDADHPLRRVLGELPVPNVIRMPLQRLSAAAVGSMMAGRDDGVEVAAMLEEPTAGNPLFVTQVLASEGEHGARLHQRGRAGQGRVVVSGGPCRLGPRRRRPRSHRDRVARADPRSGADRPGYMRSIRPPRRRRRRRGVHTRPPAARDRVGVVREVQRSQLNQQVLDALCIDGDSKIDAARLVHHAIEAGDVEALLRFAPPGRR